MNKRTTRWISLVLSLAVMVGSITYLAVGADAASEEPTDPYVYSEHDYISKDGSDPEDKSTNEDELVKPKGSEKYTYTKVLDDNISLVEDESDYDIYFDMYNQSGVNSVTEGVAFTVVVTMENSTAPDYDGEFDNEKTEYTSEDVTSLKFGLLYDAETFELTKCETNLDADKVVFTETGSGEESGVVATYDDTIRACEMPYFYFTFTPLKDFENAETTIELDENSIEVEPDDEFSVGCAKPMDFTVYESGKNDTLSNLEINYSVTGSDGKPEYHTAYLTPEFDPEVSEYFITIPEDAIIKAADITRDATAGSKKASTKVEEFTLSPGLNELHITVKATGNDSPRTYTVYVKKLLTDTLADPKVVLTKTVEYDEPNGITYHNEETKKDEKADGKVSYTISGANDLLAPGNGYVINVPKADVKNVYNYVIGNTANLKDSKITVIPTEGGCLTFDGDLDDPAKFVELDEFLENPTGSAVAANEIASMTVDGNKYLINVGEVISTEHPNYDVEEVAAASASGTGYTKLTLKEDNNTVDSAISDLYSTVPAVIDNTAAEYVIVADFSKQEWNEAVRYMLFGYADQPSLKMNGILGYIEHVQNSLSNDSTAKVTLIGLGVDYNTGTDSNGAAYPHDIRWNTDDVYVLKDQIKKHEGVGVSDDEPLLSLINGADSADGEADNVYRSQTFTIPIVARENLWGSSTELGTSEQNNIDQYMNSLNSGRGTGGQAIPTMSVDSTTDSNHDRVGRQYTDAINAAKELLSGAENPQLIVLSADHVNAANKAISASGIKNDAETTVVNIKDYVGSKSATSSDFPFTVSKNVYNDLITKDPESGFICDPADSESLLGLIDPLNSQIFWLKYADIGAEGYSYDLIDPELDAPNDYYDALWYLPSIGRYDLTGDYYVVRRTDKDAVSKLSEGHYYPISDTVDTKVLGASDSYFGIADTPVLDDVPTVAVTYEDKYALDIVKGADFSKKDGASPLNSTVKYVVKYANEGVKALTNVAITDTKILAAKNYKAYIVDNGKEPTSTDKTVSLEFKDMEDTDFPYKGYASYASLPAGKTLYLTYELVVPEVMNVTSGTSGYDKNDPSKTLQSYILENIATGTASELDDSVMAKLDTEFLYDESNGTTSGSSTSTTASTTASTAAPIPTYSPAVPTTSQIQVPVQPVVVPTGESLVGYIVAISLLFGAIGVFGVTIYGMVLDDKIEKAKAARVAGVKR